MHRVAFATGGMVQTTVNDLNDEVLGACAHFEERQVGNERFNLFTGCPLAKTATIVLRGGADQFIEELAPGSLTGFLFMFSLGGQSTTRDTAFVVGPKGARLLVLSRDAVLNMSTEKPHAERTLRLAWMSRMSVEYRQWIRHGVAVSAARGSDTTSLYQLPQMP